jgi:hypothetical protein
MPDKNIVSSRVSISKSSLYCFKSKGSSKDPKNYSAFTLMSSLEKIFTGILNNRLASLADEIILSS